MPPEVVPVKDLLWSNKSGGACRGVPAMPIKQVVPEVVPKWFPTFLAGSIFDEVVPESILGTTLGTSRESRKSFRFCSPG
jgi:hypothetical protein